MKTYFVAGLGLFMAFVLALFCGPTYFEWVASPTGLQSMYNQAIGYSSFGDSMVKSATYNGSADIIRMAFYIGCIGAGLMLGSVLFFATEVFFIVVGLLGLAYFAWNVVLYVGIPTLVIYLLVRTIDYFYGSKIASKFDELVKPVAGKLAKMVDAVLTIIGLRKAHHGSDEVKSSS